MSKTIEEIKEEVSREFLHPYRTWLENSRSSNDDNISVLEDSGAIDEVAKRYAQSQTEKLEKHLDIVHKLLYNIQNYEVNIGDNVDKLINNALDEISKL